MLRLSLLWLFVGFLSVYAFKNWYKALCGLVLLMAVIQHPDFPKSVAGIQGLNPWNVLFFFVFISWMFSRGREKLSWDMPKNINWLLFFYGVVIVVSFVRAVGSIDDIASFYQVRAAHTISFGALLSDHIINCVKWVVPGLLLYDGCNSRQRFRLAIWCILGVYVLLALQVIRWMPIASIGGGSDMAERSIKILSNEVGFHRVNISMLLAGGAWAIFSAKELITSRTMVIIATIAFATTIIGQALTGGRMGYVTWVMIALMFGVLKWRKILVIGPVVALAIVMLVPAVKERLLHGFDPDTYGQNSRIEAHEFRDDSGPDFYTVTSGRTFAWPFVLEEIMTAPILGQGRDAMISSGVATYLLLEFGESFPHPHNAYLQLIMDNGLIGAIPIFLFFYLVFRHSRALFLSENSKDCAAIGGICLALVGALLIAGMGSQSFYPREGAVGMWCAIGLMLRVHVQNLKYKKLVGDNTDQQGKDIWNLPKAPEAK